jgi:ethanolamine ammonia-lyase large subunit
LRQLLNLRPAPEFEEWLNKMGIFNGNNRLANDQSNQRFLNQFKSLPQF